MAYKAELQSNNADLQAILDKVNALPDASEAHAIDGLIERTISGEYSNSGVTSIGDYAFASCASLTSVNFPVVTSIAASAFGNCTSLTSVSFPAATFIGSSAFNRCLSLTSVNFPAVTNIGSNAFANCLSLTSANFPAVTNISDCAFGNCSSLTSVSFPAATFIGSSAFSYCSSLTSVNFPAVTNIGRSVFVRCTRLTSVNFPAITNINSYTFAYCFNLKSLTLGTSTVCTLSHSNAFASTPIGGYSTSAGTYGSIYVPASMLTSYKAATNWSYFSSRFVGLPYFHVYLATGTYIGVYNTTYGMTWGEWIDSWMNTAGYNIVDNTYIEHPDYAGEYLYDWDGTVITINDVIRTSSEELDAPIYIGIPSDK